MPIEIREIGISQFCELLGIDEHRYLGVRTNQWRDRIGILLEPEETDADHGRLSAVEQGRQKDLGRQA